MVQTWRLRKAVKMSSVCIQLVVVVVTLSLSDVASQTVQRGQAQPLTQQHISSIVDRHNIFRSLEGAANMKLMVWNSDLASKADKHARGCKWGHTRGPRTYGQNIFKSGAYLTDITPVTDTWYGEKKDYYFDSIKCRPGKKCGHYTQVVWANTRNVGCAIHHCQGFTYVVCNYSPRGNIVGKRPYVKGPACSKCSNGAGWCNGKLCNPQCTRSGKDCSCAMICYNCAKLDLETCRCKCAKGWRGMDCTTRCENIHKKCGRYNGWPKYLCNEDPIKRRCPALCGVCEADPNATEGLCPPVRGPGAGSAQTMFIKSHQSTMLIVMVIIAFTVIIYDAL